MFYVLRFMILQCNLVDRFQLITSQMTNAININAKQININFFPENTIQTNASAWLKSDIKPCVFFSFALNHC